MKLLQLLAAVALPALLLSSCGDDDSDSSESSLVGWYIQDNIPSSKDLEITDPELIQRIKDDPEDKANIFDDNGLMCQFRKNENYDGWDGSSFPTNVIHIVNSKQLEWYSDEYHHDYASRYGCCIWQQGSRGTIGKTLLYKIDGGILGPLAYYGTATNYIYTRDGDMITFVDGKETIKILITSDGLIVNGVSGKFKKYDPSKTY
jgi:hypothetical protein